MFQMAVYDRQDGLQKLGYLADLVGIYSDDIGKIVNVDPSLLRDILKQGFVPSRTPNGEEIAENLYLLRMLLSTLFRLAAYSDSEVKRFLYDTSEFQKCIVQPPWYPQNLRGYLEVEKIEGVRKSLLWLKAY